MSDYIIEGLYCDQRPIRGRCVQWQFAGYPAPAQILQRKGPVCAATAQIIALRDNNEGTSSWIQIVFQKMFPLYIWHQVLDTFTIAVSEGAIVRLWGI